MKKRKKNQRISCVYVYRWNVCDENIMNACCMVTLIQCIFLGKEKRQMFYAFFLLRVCVCVCVLVCVEIAFRFDFSFVTYENKMKE